MKIFQNRKTRRTVREILRDLNYDYTLFSIEHLTEFVEKLIGRRIILIKYNMPMGVFGMWLTGKMVPVEYIFYDQNQTLNLTVQTVVHELAHIIFNHATLSITLNDLEKEKIDRLICHSQVRRREQCEQFSLAEAEAEFFTTMFRVKVWDAKRKTGAVYIEQTEPSQAYEFVQLWEG